VIKLSGLCWSYIEKEVEAQMDKTLASLIKISNAIGKDRLLVQGGGGNTSVKTDDSRFMYIKASGTALKDMNEKKGWRRLRLEPVLSIIKDISLTKCAANIGEAEVINRLLLACDDDITADVRPSLESFLHAFLDKCVIHLHPCAVGSYVNAKNGKSELGKLFKDNKPPILWVPYADPGFTLANKIAGLIDNYQKQFGKKPAILFLEKHGLLVSASGPNTAMRLVGRVIKRCSGNLRQPKAGKIKLMGQQAIHEAKLCIRGAFFKATGEYRAISYFLDNSIAGFWREKNARKMLSSGILTTDELVYANGPAMWLEKLDRDAIAHKLTRQINRGKLPCAAFLVKGLGLFVAGREKTAGIIRDVTVSSFFIRTNALRLGGISSLSIRQQDLINQSESETFRKKLADSSGHGTLQNRIAVVSGSGSGLGKSIAIGLARAGAMVGLVEIDTEAARETSKLIKDELSEASTLVLGCDVTSEPAVDSVFSCLLESWGGLDILVNAAGIAPAYPLVDFPVDKWRLALEVNLTGYFLMARAAARIMIEQTIGGSIINLSSQTGIDASKNNSSYNTTKAGELHMARGWAMELGEHNIRVNSVCPGNVFEGSKIWNPEYIKTCAKKYGIKPDEVIDYYVSKTMLNREIKGRDIAEAVVFLASDNARMITAQTLVADAGQAMVR